MTLRNSGPVTNMSSAESLADSADNDSFLRLKDKKSCGAPQYPSMEQQDSVESKKNTDNSALPRFHFDFPLATVIAGYAFEAYATPVSD